MAEGFTPVQTCMLHILSDGLCHFPDELRGCCPDDMVTLKNVRAHLSILRKKLRPIGEDVICQWDGGKFKYRHVRLITSSHDGRS